MQWDEQTSGKRKTENRSFRIDLSVLASLEDEAKRNKVSVSTLVNQLFEDYVEVGRYRKRIGTVSIASNTFEQIISATPEEALVKVAHSSGANVPKAYVLSKWGSMKPEHLISYIKESAGATGLYEYSESTENPGVITLTHRYSRKWSVYLANYFSTAFQTFGMKVDFDVNEQAVALSVRSTASSSQQRA